MVLVAEKAQAEFCSPRRRASAGSRSERIYRFDLSLFNEIAVTEGLGIQIRAEAFNAFNSTMLSNPDSNLASIQFGCARLTGTRVEGESPSERRQSHATILREPCVAAREGRGEASVAVRVGSAMERRKDVSPECRDGPNRRRQHGTARDGEGRPGSAASKNTGTHASPWPGSGRPPSHPVGSPTGSLREGRVGRSRRWTGRRSQTGAQ